MHIKAIQIQLMQIKSHPVERKSDLLTLFMKKTERLGILLSVMPDSKNETMFQGEIPHFFLHDYSHANLKDSAPQGKVVRDGIPSICQCFANYGEPVTYMSV